MRHKQLIMIAIWRQLLHVRMILIAECFSKTLQEKRLLITLAQFLQVPTLKHLTAHSTLKVRTTKTQSVSILTNINSKHEYFSN